MKYVLSTNTVIYVIKRKSQGVFARIKLESDPNSFQFFSNKQSELSIDCDRQVNLIENNQEVKNL